MNNNNEIKVYNYKFYFDSKKDAKLFMHSLPTRVKNNKLVIGDGFRIDLYKTSLDIQSKFTETEFRNLYNI